MICFTPFIGTFGAAFMVCSICIFINRHSQERTHLYQMTVLYNEFVVYRTIVLGNSNIMESALPSVSESGLGEVDNSAICVGVRAKAKKKKTTKQAH